LPELFSLLLEAMRGVAAAHKQGVVHRDIKPDNIFLARRGDSARPVPNVLDFGSAGGAGRAAGGSMERLAALAEGWQIARALER
ncbi:MAG TPA: hypothetical protein VF331_20555, partial [Polyangiales bacterium]